MRDTGATDRGAAVLDDRPAVGGERIEMHERLVVAPAVGIFRPLPPGTVTAEGELVEAGQTIGVLETPGASTPVRSKFAGFLMGMLAREGERVRAGQPVAWLRPVQGGPGLAGAA